MPDIYLHEHTVHADEIDPLGHANNVAFVQWMQDAAIAHSTAQGWPMGRYREIGMAWVVRRHTVEYLLPAMEGERIVVRTWVADMQRVTSRRRYEILSGERLLARAETNWAFIKTSDGKLTRVPENVVSSFILVPDVIANGRVEQS
jgi:acyl-CoA thioester hydrolase